MAEAEKVIIDIIANDKATSILENIRGKLIEINNLSSKYSQMVSSLNQSASNTQSKINENINGGSSSSSSPKGTGSTQPNPNDSKLEDFNQTVKPKVEVPNTNEIQSRLDKGTIPVMVSPTVNTQNITREVQSRLDTSQPTVKPKVEIPKPSTKEIDDSVTKATYLGQTISQTAITGANSVNTLTNSTNNAGKSVTDLGSKTKSAMRVGTSAFHEMNNLMVTVGGQFTNLSNQIAGIFGAMGLSGMVEKMWKGASERQTNMLYLMHQRGVEQANQYYDEIMRIVTQLPGDDTFLTNILNMSAAMDKNIKLDNLKELGSAITDYYIASTMKGELPFETQKDMRKYMTTGDTRPLRNSLLASEIDLLKDKNSILERGKALQEALDKTGFTGMSQYESATNALEELKGHFQKAFADLGGLVIAVTQPLMKFYNTLDTLFGSRLSQAIILMASVLVGLFGIIGIGMVVIPTMIRNFEILGMGLRMLTWITEANVVSHGKLNTILTMLIGKENALAIAKNGNVVAGIREIAITYENILARKLEIDYTQGQTVSLIALSGATLNRIKEKIITIALTIRNIALGVEENVLIANKTVLEGRATAQNLTSLQVERAKSVLLANSIRLKITDTFQTIKSTISLGMNTVQKWLHTDASLSEAFAISLKSMAQTNDNISTDTNTIKTVQNTLSKLSGIGTTLQLIGSIILETTIKWISTEATFSEALANTIDAETKGINIGATYGLATAIGVLEGVLSPLIFPILLIIGALVALVVVVEKVGEAFGWWKDLGSMIDAISSGISRLWNAFVGSDVIQGIISYFQNFVTSIQYVFDSITNALSMLFGWDTSNTGTFDIVQTIIDLFGTLGDTVKWVWDLIDDWADSPLGFITWLNPLGIIMFHLDEIGSLFEDISDAIDRFTGTTEFQELMEGLGEVWEELQAPFQEIASLIDEIMQMFGELFGGGSDPDGRGTEDRINLIVELLKGIATVIRVVILPIIRIVATVIRAILTPIRVILYVIGGIVTLLKGASEFLGGVDVIWDAFISPLRFIYDALRQVIDAVIWLFSLVGTGVGESILFIVNAISSAIQGIIKLFGSVGQIFSGPLGVVLNIIERISALVNATSKVIKNSFIGKLLGWDKEDDGSDGNKNKYNGNIRKSIGNSDITRNVNNVRNLGRTYNSTNNQRQVVINQNFSEGSMPIDARNMTKKEAKKMFVGAFGYNRTVGKHGILR